MARTEAINTTTVRPAKTSPVMSMSHVTCSLAAPCMESSRAAPATQSESQCIRLYIVDADDRASPDTNPTIDAAAMRTGHGMTPERTAAGAMSGTLRKPDDRRPSGGCWLHGGVAVASRHEPLVPAADLGRGRRGVDRRPHARGAGGWHPSRLTGLRPANSTHESRAPPVKFRANALVMIGVFAVLGALAHVISR